MSGDILKKLEAEARKHMHEHRFLNHGFDHAQRVRELCRLIGKRERANILVLEVAAIFHDIGRIYELKDKTIDHAEKSAEICAKILKQLEFPDNLIPQVLYAIKMHRSRYIGKAETLEAKILQDADKIDACGAVGIAKTFAHAGYHNADLYDVDDPFAEKRVLDDNRFALDHFRKKLLKLADMMNTRTGKELAVERKRFMNLFLKEFREEIKGEK